MYHTKSQVRCESHGWLIPLPSVQADCAHASLTKEIHRLGSEGLAQAFPSVAWKGSRRAKITPVGVKILVILPVGAGCNSGHKLPVTSDNLDPLRAKTRVLCPPLGQNPGPEPLSGIGSVCQLYECLFLIRLQSANDTACRQMLQTSPTVKVGGHLVKGAVSAIPSLQQKGKPLTVERIH